MLRLQQLRERPRRFAPEGYVGAASRLGLQSCHPSRQCGPALSDLAELRGEFGIVNSYQDLPLLHQGAFLDKNVADDPAFQGLDNLDLPGRNDLSVAALDLLEDCKMCP